MEHFDIIVIGSGPAGEGAAMMAAKNHRRVAVVERHAEVGGGCTHWGTIPSKALRHAVKTLHDARRNPLLRDLRPHLNASFPQLLASAVGVIESQVASRRRFYDRNRVPVYRRRGRASWTPHTVEVRKRSRASPCGCAPNTSSSPPARAPTTRRGWTSRTRACATATACCSTATARSAVTIYGAGVIGCEYASIFLNLGCKVTLVNTHERLLSFLDEEIAEALSYHLREQGCVIRHNEQFAGIEARERRRRAAAEVGPAHQVRRAAVGQRPHRQHRRHEPRGRWGSSPTGAASCR